MSCTPDGLECGSAMAHLDEFLDGEVGPDDRARMSAHLDACGPCLQEYDVEQLVKSLVARSCCQHAPTELHVRVMAEILRLSIRPPHLDR